MATIPYTAHNFIEATRALYQDYSKPAWELDEKPSSAADAQREAELWREIKSAFLGDVHLIERWVTRAAQQFPGGSEVERLQWIIEAYRHDNR